MKVLNFLFYYLFIKKGISIKINFLSINLILLIILNLFIINFYRLFFYSFSITRTIYFNLFLTSIYFIKIFFFEIKNLKIFFIHLCPENSPLLLRLFIILIEFIRSIIRPLTLFLRLTINISSGHIMLLMISLFIFKLKMTLKLIYFTAVALFVFFKFTISIVQRVIFFTLIYMYRRNINKYFL